MNNVKNENIYEDIKNTFGFVPEFLQSLPPSGIEGAWQEVKGLYLNSGTALPAKIKDLLCIAIDAHASSEKLMYLDVAMAKLDNVTEEEIREACTMAALTRHWSAFLNGARIDEHAFCKEVDKIVSHIKSETKKGTFAPPEIPLNTAGDVYQDVRNIFGRVPEFIQAFPRNAVVGAWKTMKYVQLNPNTALSLKTKELIGLAVASLVPCKYCIYFHTEAAQLNGATEEEIKETVAIAGFSRFWSVFVDGLRLDPSKFRQEVDAMAESTRKQMAA